MASSPKYEISYFTATILNSEHLTRKSKKWNFSQIEKIAII